MTAPVFTVTSTENPPVMPGNQIIPADTTAPATDPEIAGTLTADSPTNYSADPEVTP